jgi:hypothetical protein
VLAQQYSAVEDDMFTACVYDEDEDIDAEGGMMSDKVVQMLAIRCVLIAFFSLILLEDDPVATSSMSQID